MRRRIIAALSPIAACAFALLCFVMPAQAKEVTIEASRFGSFNSELSASITFDDNIVEGTPTVFTINASNCMRQPEFLFNALSRNGEQIIDLSYQRYSTKNSFQEQLHYGGTYKLRFYVTVYGDRNENNQRPPLQMQAFEVQFTMTAAGQIKPASEIIDEVVASCNEACAAQGDTSQYAKALWLNDWLINNTEYDSGLTHNEADSIFIDKKGTCEAYHAAYVTLLNKVGIETRRVDWGGNVNHVWTGAKLDGKWYNIDTTWNDYDPVLDIDTHHLYFGMPTEAMRYARPEWDGTYNAGNGTRPAFTATDYEGHYFIKTGKIEAWSGVYEQSTTGDYSVKAHIDKKETSFSLPIEKKHWPDNYKNAIYPLVAYQLAKTNWGDGVLLSVKYSNDSLEFTARYDTVPMANVTIASIPDQKYTGSPIKPALQISYKGKKLVEGADYTLAYSSMINVGTAKVTITGKGNYIGQTSVSFNIVKKDTSASNPGTSTTPATPAKYTGTWIKSGWRWWFQYDSATQKATGKQYPTNEIVTINGVRYGFDGSGWMRTGWHWADNSWYYFLGSGAMAYDWQWVNGNWYFMKADGKMATGWLDDRGARYYLSGSGNMATGWLKLGGTWYLFANSGTMLTGWQRVGGAWYYMNSDGSMRTSELTEKGITYRFANSGAMLTGWHKFGTTWYYFNGSGAMVKNAWVGNYWLQADGTMATSKRVDGGKYYVGADGAWIRGR